MPSRQLARSLEAQGPVSSSSTVWFKAVITTPGSFLFHNINLLFPLSLTLILYLYYSIIPPPPPPPVQSSSTVWDFKFVKNTGCFSHRFSTEGPIAFHWSWWKHVLVAQTSYCKWEFWTPSLAEVTCALWSHFWGGSVHLSHMGRTGRDGFPRENDNSYV